MTARDTSDGAHAASPLAADVDDALDVSAAMVRLELGRNAVYDGCARGEIPHRRIGKLFRNVSTRLRQRAWEFYVATARAAGDGWISAGSDTKSCGAPRGRCLSVGAVASADAPPTTAETATTSVAIGLMVTTAGGRGTVGGPFGNRWG